MRSLKYTPLAIGVPYIAATIVLSALGVSDGTWALPSRMPHPTFGISFTISRALFVVLVTIIANTVYAYTDGSMRNEPKVKQFVVSSSIFFLATYAMVFAPSILQFAIATSISTVALGYATFLIPFQDRSKRPRYPWHLHVGDLLLLIVAVITSGHQNQRSIEFVLLLWTFSRAGLLPFSKWVVSSVNAPTAASVMIHGGYVNAPAIALLYFCTYRLFNKVELAIVVALAIATIIWSALAKSFAKDAKGRLAVSTCGQMSFMVLEILSGLPVLGLFHAVGHGLFKSYLLYDVPSDPFNKSDLLQKGATENRGSKKTHATIEFRNRSRAIVAITISAAVMVAITYATGVVSFSRLSALIPETVGLAIAFYAAVNVSFGHQDRAGATTIARLLASSIVIAPWLAFIVVSRISANYLAGQESVHLAIWIPSLLALIAPITIKKSPTIDKLALGHFLHRSYAASASSLTFSRKLKRTRNYLDSMGLYDPSITTTVEEGVERITSEIALSLPTVNFVAVNPFQSQIAKNFLDVTTPNGDLPLPSLSTLANLYDKGEIEVDHLAKAAEETLELYPHLVPSQLRGTKDLTDTIRKVLEAHLKDNGSIFEAKNVTNDSKIDELVEEASILLMDAIIDNGTVIEDDKAITARIFELTLGHRYAKMINMKHTSSDDLQMIVSFKIAQIAIALGATTNDRVSKLIATSNDLIPGWLTLMNRSAQGGIGDRRREGAVASIIFALLFTALVLGFDYNVLTESRGPKGKRSETSQSEKHEIKLAKIGLADIDLTGHDLTDIDRATFNDDDQVKDIVRVVSHRALELSYRSDLLEKIASSATAGPIPQGAEIDMLFCIDVRSESMRKFIEDEFRGVRTFGVAGFFGLPFRVRSSTPSTLRAPILLDPQLWAKIKRVVPRSEEVLNDIAASYEILDQVPSLSLITAEVIGLYMGLASLLKTNFPNFTSRMRTNKQIQRANLEALRSIELEEMTDAEVEEVASNLAATLQSIGLVRDFADSVLLVGHQSSNANQLHRMAYQCGACGGNSGAENATLIAKLLNRDEVRAKMASYGIQIPTSTTFISAIHDTTAATIEVVTPLESSMASHAEILKITSAVNQQEKRTSAFANVKGLGRSREIRSNWWFEGWPEMGLANAASFIIAPRTLTRGLDLGGRSFLQSYDLRYDPDGSALASIMAAPMVVGEMISKSYYFAALDQSVITSNKTILNPVSNLGAISGTSGDLVGGLARQAFTMPDGRLAHTPLRLTGLIYAPKESVKSIVVANPLLKESIENKWMHIIVLDSSDGNFYDIYDEISDKGKTPCVSYEIAR